MLNYLGSKSRLFFVVAICLLVLAFAATMTFAAGSHKLTAGNAGEADPEGNDPSEKKVLTRQQSEQKVVAGEAGGLTLSVRDTFLETFQTGFSFWRKGIIMKTRGIVLGVI